MMLANLLNVDVTKLPTTILRSRQFVENMIKIQEAWFVGALRIIKQRTQRLRSHKAGMLREDSIFVDFCARQAVDLCS